MGTQRLLGVATLVVCLGWVGLVHAQTTMYWEGDTSDEWFDGNNWDPEQTPDPMDQLYIDLAHYDPLTDFAPNATVPVTLGLNGLIHIEGTDVRVDFNAPVRMGTSQFKLLDGAFVEVQGLTLGDSAFTGAAMDCNNASMINYGYTWVGEEGTGSLEIGNGSHVATLGAEIAAESGADGSQAAVSGPDSVWRVAGGDGLTVGGGGEGALVIQGGGEVSSEDGALGWNTTGQGTVTIKDEQSVWDCNGVMKIGYEGANNTVTVEDGGTLRSRGGRLSWTDLSSDNLVTITGGGGAATPSTWDAQGSSFYVGFSGGHSTVSVEAGGQLLTDGGVIGYHNSSSSNAVLITDPNSLWDALGATVTVGRFGEGQLDIDNGGSVMISTLYIGRDFGASGAVTLMGTDSNLSVEHDLYVGHEGDGALFVYDGSEVAGVDELTIAYNPSSHGTVRIVGSSRGGESGVLVDTDTTIGLQGEASLELGYRGTLQTGRSAVLGHFADGSGYVELSAAGADWQIDQDLTVGKYGEGSILFDELNSNQIAVGNDATIGQHAGSQGDVTLNGAGAVFDVGGDLWVGDEGGGTLNVFSGEVRVGDTLHIGNPASSIHLHGGTLQFGHFGNPWEGTLDWTRGVLHVAGEDVVIGQLRPLGNWLDIDEDMTLIVDQTLVIEPMARLSVNQGGRVLATDVQNDGDLEITPLGKVTISNELVNNADLALYGGTISGYGTLVNGFAGLFRGRGAIETDFTNFGQATITANTDAYGTTLNYGLFQMGERDGSSVYGPPASYRSHGLFDNRGLVVLYNTIDGSGSLINQPGGIIETGENLIHGISIPVTNLGLIYAKAHELEGGLYLEATSSGQPEPDPDVLGTTLVLMDLSGGNLSGGELRVDDQCTIEVHSGFENAGLIRLLGPNSQFLGEDLIDNTGTIYGQGRLSHDIDNRGLIYAEEDTDMLLTGAMTNAPNGVMNVQSDATLGLT